MSLPRLTEIAEKTVNPDKFTFHDGASIAGNGNVFTVNGSKVAKIGIKQNTTNSLIEFRGTDEAGNDSLVNGYKSDYKIAYTSTTENNVTFDLDISLYTTVYIKTVANNILIKGKIGI